ncbi:MAG: glyoxylate/hydroxypyruvate reductase A [Bacteroidota bacterium]
MLFAIAGWSSTNWQWPNGQQPIMSILIICNEPYASNWSRALKEKLPSVEVEIYPGVGDYSKVEMAIVWKAPAGLFSEFSNLKIVQSLGAGVKHVFDGQHLDEKVKVTRIVDPQLSEDMWEYVLMLSLNHLRNTRIFFQKQLKKEWQELRYKNIKDTTVSILGLGKIGSHVAVKMAGIGFNVQGWSGSEKSILGVKSFFGKNGLEELLNTTDILVNILPLTAETTNLLNKDNLLKLKKGAYLINVGRGPHLVDEDLIELLDAAYLSGAALDVFHEEPLPEKHPFWAHPKITVMPHVAGMTNIKTAVSQVVENYQRMKKGKQLINIVSQERKY